MGTRTPPAAWPSRSPACTAPRPLMSLGLTGDVREGAMTHAPRISRSPGPGPAARPAQRHRGGGRGEAPAARATGPLQTVPIASWQWRPACIPLPGSCAPRPAGPGPALVCPFFSCSLAQCRLVPASEARMVNDAGSKAVADKPA